MLSYNSIVYIAYTLVLIVIITCLTYMNAEACSGYDLVEKTEMQDERIGKIYMGFCSVFITVVMVVFSIIGRQFFWMCRNTLAELAKR